MATPKQRAEERRQAKLDEVQQQSDDGSLTVRKITAKERAEHPPRPRQKRGKRR